MMAQRSPMAECLISFIKSVIQPIIDKAKTRKSGDLRNVTWHDVMYVLESLKRLETEVPSFSKMEFQNDHKIICGTIGAGKSTWASRLAQSTDSVYMPEEIDIPIEPFNPSKNKHLITPISANPYLDDFYMKKIDGLHFEMELYLLLVRLSAHLNCIVLREHCSVIQDRSLFEDAIFVEMLCDEFKSITKEDKNTYLYLTKILEETVFFKSYPFTIEFIDVMPRVALNQIRGRRRECEDNITFDYMQHLDAEYRKFMMKMYKKAQLADSNYKMVLIYERTDSSKIQWCMDAINT